MNEIIHLSESKCNFIHLQIIKTLSVLIININNKVILYYILSNNFINKIITSINSELIKSDEDFLSHYVNFLKSISLKIDLTTIQFFFMSQTGSFPLLESALSLYNHQDKMIQSVVKNILLIMLKLNSPQLIEYICSLPSLAYFCFLSCRLKDSLITLSKESNYEIFKSIQEDIIDELIFIQDILYLKIEKINHIIINSLFYYCILPYVLNTKFNKIKLNIKLYFINALLTIIQDECFLNIFFTVLLFPFVTKEINDFIANFPKLPDNYFNEWTEENNNIQLISKSLINFVKYNFNEKSYKYILSSNNEKFSDIKKIKTKYKSDSIDENVLKDEVNNYILNNLTPEQKNDILDYYNNISLATGLSCGININNENSSNKCFKNIIQKLYLIYFDKSLELKNKLIDNNFKDFLFSLINITNYSNENILLQLCVLIRNIIIKNNDKISKILLKQVKLIRGDFLNEDEINSIKKINNDKELIKNILIHEEFHEFDDDDEDDDDFEKIIEKRNQKLIINQKDNEKINKSILLKENEKNKFLNFDKNYFYNIEKNIEDINVEEKLNNNNYLYYYDISLIETFIDILNFSNNLMPIFFKCITEIILSLVSKNKDNNIILFVSERIISKVEKIYNNFKDNIINSYKTNKKFGEFGYNIFQKQYNIFLTLDNFDYDEIIKQGYIILNKNLQNFNPYNLSNYENIIINNKQFVRDEEEILNNNIINFFIIHDFYYIISNIDNNNNSNRRNNLFINKYPLLFDELNINEQYLLCDLHSDIKYFSCKCKITKQNKSSNNYFDCTVLIYENKIYIGNSSSNPNYTRIVNKYHLSDCTLKISENILNCLDLFFPEDKNNYSIVELIFLDSESLNQKLNIINEDIEKSKDKEKQKLENFLNNLV